MYLWKKKLMKENPGWSTKINQDSDQDADQEDWQDDVQDAD